MHIHIRGCVRCILACSFLALQLNFASGTLVWVTIITSLALRRVCLRRVALGRVARYVGALRDMFDVVVRS